MNIFKGIVLPVLAAGTMSVAAYGDGIKANDTVQFCKKAFDINYHKELKKNQDEKKMTEVSMAWYICLENDKFRQYILKEKCDFLDGKMVEKKLSDGTTRDAYCKTRYGVLTDAMLQRADFKEEWKNN